MRLCAKIICLLFIPAAYICSKVLARVVTLILIFFGWFAIGLSMGFAQIATDINDSMITPRSNSGHDYIHLLDETVNPATGSVSLRINIPLPKQRGFNLPFSIGYDSNGFTAPVQGWGQGGLGYMEPTIDGPSVTKGPCNFADGWHYTFPCLSSVETLNTFLTNAANDASVTCDWMSGYVFYDPSGASHALYMTLADTYQNQNGGGTCSPTSTAIMA